MNGSVVTEVLWIIGLTVLIFLIAFVVLPRFWKDIAQTAIFASPEVIVKDISGLITISGAAPHSIQISYDTNSKKYSYNLDVNQRNITLEMISGEVLAKKVKAKVNDEIPIDPNSYVPDSTTFTIEKTRNDDVNYYEVYP
jgi:hypothetical protein